MDRALEERIAAIARRQHGVVTHRQLIDAGLSRHAVVRRLAAARLRPLHRGVYLASALPLPYTPEMAAVLAMGSGALVSHRSVARLRGWLSGAGAGNGASVDVVVTRTRSRRRGVRIHQVGSIAEEDRATLAGIPVTGPLRTLIDLAGVLGPHELEAAVARAEREGLVAADKLAARVAREGPRRGMPALRTVLGLPGGPALTRSEAEAEFLALVREARLPPPACNVRVGQHEVDFFWRAARLAVEVDGYRYHSSKPSFEEDRHRDADLVAAGLTVLRLSWRQITSERLATAARLAPALARVGRR